MIMIIAKTVRILMCVDGRKESFMLLEQLKTRLRNEYNALRLYLTTAKLTAGDILNRAYEVVWKEEIVCLFESMVNADGRYTDEILLWILKEPNALEYLYGIWLHADYLLTSEFADILFDELIIRKDGSKHE